MSEDARLFFIFAKQNIMTMLKYKFPVIAVYDIEESMRFYEDVIGDRVVESYDDYVHFAGGYALRELEEKIPNEFSDITLCFEEDDLEGFAQFLKEEGYKFVIEDLHENPNGQRSITLLDPNDHFVEVAENMETAMKRMLKSGMTVEQVSEKSQYPIEYVKRFV